MIDTGAEPNLIKISALQPATPVKVTDRIQISGITAGTVQTLGSTDAEIYGTIIRFHVVPHDFPIATDGILGASFLEEGAEISYTKRRVLWKGLEIPFANATSRDSKPNPKITKSNTSANNAKHAKPNVNHTESDTRASNAIHAKSNLTRTESDTRTINARTAQTTVIRAVGPEIGYLPRQEIVPGVTVYDSLVKNINGTVCIRCINQSEKPITFRTPTVEIMEVIAISKTPTDVDQTSGSTSIHAIQNTKSCMEREAEIAGIISTDHLNPEEYEHVKCLIAEHSDIFHLPGEYLGKTSAVTHKIPTTDQRPIHVKQYRYPPIHKEEIDRQMKELLESDIVSPSTSPYSSPLWIVPKKSDEQGNKEWRMVIDYRSLNEKTIADAYPLPSIVEILDQLGSAKYFSTFDLASGFHQIGMDEKDAEKTAFSTPFGHYEFNRMPFGLRNAPATFQRLMDSILSGLQGTELFVYLDDIVIYASSLSEHKAKFNRLAERLRRANLKLQPSKCSFLRREVAYLGHIISDEGVKPCPTKISAVKNFPGPKNAKTVREFLGLAGYYRRFINKFSHITKPLTALLRKDTKFEWSAAQERAFETLRNALCTEPVLRYPDFAETFHITTDASGYAVGGILSQGPIGQDRPIAYASRLLHGAELNYSTIEKECLAIIYAVQHFRPYVYGKPFNLITDHQPLVWMHSVKDPSSRLLRWRLKLAEYEYKVVYKAGKRNVNADALSRNPDTTAVLPVSSDSSDIPIFESRHQPVDIPFTSNDMQYPQSPPPPIPSILPEQHVEAHLETDSDMTETPHRIIKYSRDRLIMRNDNLACFMTLDNQPRRGHTVPRGNRQNNLPLRHAFTHLRSQQRTTNLPDEHPEPCQMLHRTGTLYFTPSTQITGVAANSSTARSLTLSGKIENDGTCFGSTFSDPYGTWNSVVVQAVIRIKIRTHIAAVKLATNEIILQSGQRYLVQQGSCLDSEDGFSYWDNSPTDYCKFNNYDVLYEGKATIVEDEDNQGLSLYSVTSQGTTFALARTTSTKVCGCTLIHTEHPKLFILETEKEGHFKTRTPIAINNLDIFAYVNSKFVYVEKHLKTQIIQLYRDVVKQKCALERQIMHNALTLIHVTPAEVATTIAKEHGFMAIASGEVIHIVKCIPVVCQVRHTDTCYDELPVTYKNTSLFITPIHHILTRSGTRKDCSELMPNMFRIHGLWYRLTPKPVESLPPTPLKPLTKATWKYVNPHNLADGGIYSPEDLAKLKEHIMFPIERPAIVNSLAQGATGREYSSQALQLYNLFDETTLNKLAESTGKRIWSGFITFGSFTAGIMGIYLAIRVIKAAVSTIINGIALHSVYGWSLHLLGAAWSSLTHFFLFLSQRKTNN
ncbi:Retrovirus-related Pol polyprotein from transposon 297 [Anthophora retusa]